MKVALISHLYPTKLFPKGGKFIQDHYNLLISSEKYDVDLIIPTPYSIFGTKRFQKNHSPLADDPKKSSRVRYLSFPKRNFPKTVQKSLSKNIIKHLRNNHYDLIHLHWLNPDGLAVPSIKKAGFKTVLTIHGSDWYLCQDKPVLMKTISETFEAVDHVLYSGPKLKNDIENLFPELNNKSDIIYNMVDTDKYKPVNSTKKKELKIELGWDTNKIHSLTIAHLRPEKGIDILIDSIIENEDLKDVQFHIVGGKEETKYSKKILSIIDSNPYNNIILHPPVLPKDLISYYQAAEFYIMPSRREGFNVSILEAASCGLPLICSNVSGAKEVTELGMGLFVSNHSELTANISNMIINYPLYDPLEQNMLIQANYGKRVFKERLEKIYAQVIK